MNLNLNSNPSSISNMVYEISMDSLIMILPIENRYSGGCKNRGASAIGFVFSVKLQPFVCHFQKRISTCASITVKNGKVFCRDNLKNKSTSSFL